MKIKTDEEIIEEVLEEESYVNYPIKSIEIKK
jgi:hypothetical protein